MTLSTGEQLRQAREARKLSLEQVAQATRIRQHYLQALENDALDKIPSAVQARGFLRSYAGYLNLDLGLAGTVVQEGAVPAAAPPPEPAAPPPEAMPHVEQAEAIFVEIGARLHRQREILGLSQEDIERHTHLRLHYLKALESGRIGDLPSPVQGRGMLSNYANFLGLDPEPLLLRFAEGLQASLAARQVARLSTQPVKARPAPSRFRFLRRLFSADLLVSGLLVIFIGGFIIWGGLRIFSMRSAQQPTVTAPSIADVLAMTTVTPSPSATSASVETQAINAPTQERLQTTPEQTDVPLEQATQPLIELLPPTETATLPPFSLSAVQLYIVVQQRAWMRVIVDGEEQFSGRVVPGSAYLYSGKERIEILTGNGAALNIYFNQEELGSLGIFGEIVDRVYTPEGVLAPTATITPTGTPTGTPMITPTPTSSSTGTLTP